MSSKTKVSATKSATKEDSNPALVPQLRFPEFQEADGWRESLLKEMLTEHELQSDGKCEVHSVSVHKGVINQKEHLGRSFAAADTSRYNLAKPYDVIYTKSPTGDFPFGVVKHNHLGFNVIVSPLYGVFSPETPWLGYIFDAYFESPSRANSYLAPITQKGAKNTIQITNQTFLSKGLYLPRDPAEQKKIAEFLTSVDELIVTQVRKVDALKTHKKGLIQQLFPREGETQPRLRFPEFQDAEEWKEKRLGKLFSNRVEKGTAGLPLYSVTMNDGMVKRASLAREFDDIATPEGNKRVHKRDISYNMMRMWQGALGVAIEDCLVSPAYIVLSPCADVWPDFFAYLFKLPESLRLLTAHSRGLTKDRLRLYYNDFALIPVRCPGFSEQQRIADCLTSLDDLIAANIKKLEALKTHKNGLLQQLFPSSGRG
ncbi:type I restriction modification DNA specificity domain protein [Lysobacter capsici]|uniref:restriction endonuclease subunit S n=1 Tax=Lysobacter capsici TaxID=435897 RepID=UPI00072236AA|nr:restriction endonuclease subunit S [Lysobacter capsici]ALN88588.1 type I restriction modification DNA specificity domain protein [Lysobacter capsici]